MKFILGEKAEMTQLFQSDGKVVAVTVVKAGPCQVTQVKTESQDGYKAVQVGYGKKKKISKPLTGHLKSLPPFRYLREFRSSDDLNLTRGQEIKVNVFQAGDKVKITGLSKGKGFQGVVKRHGFSGSPASHGHKDQLRMPGSIGSTDAARVFKGKRMPGRMGSDRVTVANLEILEVDVQKNLLYLKGAVPGARGGLLVVQGPGELKIVEENQEPNKAPNNQAEKVTNEPSVKIEDNKKEDRQEKVEEK
ncbi:50S ribosomal protein L3 [Patescibacteria group bacterium]|nr:50S ribosomal protein L3 [Patescibacteria group bacterium]